MRPLLSPSRIVLLVLIDMYCENEVLESDDDFVLHLITSYMSDSYARPSNQRQRHLARWQRAYLSVDLLLSVQNLRPALQSCFVARPAPAGEADTTPEIPLCVTLWDELVTRLWMHLRCLDSLATFFEHMVTHVAPTYSTLRARREMGLADPPESLMQLDRRSPMGLLVYEAAIEFESLTFPGRCSLWEQFVRYRNPLRADFKILWPHDYVDVVRTIDGMVGWMHEDGAPVTADIHHILHGLLQPDGAVAASSDETEKLVAILVDKEKNGFRPDGPLREAVDRIIAGTTRITAETAQYRELDAMRMGDMTTTYDQLHRYFDLVARQPVGSAYGYNLGPMTKAIVQRDFGEHSNDLLSMLDSVHAGRESRDYSSLRFSLMWLYMYARLLPRHIRPHELQGLAGRPTDSDQVLPYVRHEALAAHSEMHYAMSCLLEARVALGDGHLPLFAKNLLRDGSRHIAAINETALEGLLMSNTMTFWETLGHAPLGTTHARAFMCTRQNDVPFDDAVRVATRLALLHAQSGDFGQAKAAVMAVNPEGLSSLRPQNTIRHMFTLIAALQAVRAHRFDEADELLLRRLPQGGYPSSAPDESPGQGPVQVDAEIAVAATLLHVRSLAARDDASLVQARQKLDAFEAAYDSDLADVQTMLRIELARADLYARAGRGMRAVTLLLHTVLLCLRHHYHELLWEAAGELAQLLAAEGEFRAAQALLAAVIPRSLETQNAQSTALLYQHLGDAYMGMAGEACRAKGREGGFGAQDKRRTKMHDLLSKAYGSLVEAKEYFHQAGMARAVTDVVDAKLRVIVSTTQRLGVA